MSILDNLPHTATAKRRVRVKDTLGGSSDSYATVFSDRACWCQQAGDSESADYAQRGITVSNKAYFTSDPGLDETHLLTIGGTDYYVKSHPELDASAGLGVLWRVMRFM